MEQTLLFDALEIFDLKRNYFRGTGFNFGIPCSAGV